MKGITIFLVVALLLVGVLYASGVVTGDKWWLPNSGDRPAKESTTQEKVVELGSATSAQVELKMGSGDVTVKGGAYALMDATFIYNVAAWKPIVDYVVKGNEGRLTVREPSGTTTITGTGWRNEWDIRLSATTPIDLVCKTGAGDADLDLRNTLVRSVTVDGGASKTTIKAASSVMTNVEVKAGVGDVNLDLTGEWKNNATVGVNGGVGSVRLTVPEDVGVTINVRKGVGAVMAHGLVQDGTTYHNAAYGQSPVTITVDLSVGVGSITITRG